MRKLVHGWGINDVDYVVEVKEIVDGKYKHTWICPYYKKWRSMIQRGCSKLLQEKYQNYKGCTVCEEWKYLSNFIKWVDSQPNRDWENCDLDKDILKAGNKIYSGETCVFVSGNINRFILDCRNNRGGYMIGVTLTPSTKKPYMAQCRNPFTNKAEYLGIFATEIAAHKAWQKYKHVMACLLADLQEDLRVAKALRERYAPNQDWTRL